VRGSDEPRPAPPRRPGRSIPPLRAGGVAGDDQHLHVSPPTSKPKANPGTRAYRLPWADLLKKVFAADVLAFPDGCGRLQVIAFIADDAVARRILLHLGLNSRGPPVARAQAPPDFSEPGPSYDGADPACAD